MRDIYKYDYNGTLLVNQGFSAILKEKEKKKAASRGGLSRETY